MDEDLILSRLERLIEEIRASHTSPWLTTAEAADYLRSSVRHIERLASQGLLPFKRQNPGFPKSPRLFHRKHLTAFIVSGKNPVTDRLTPAEKREIEALS
jgi:excisionase family DNA binding protein